MHKITIIIPCYRSELTITIVVDSIKKEFLLRPQFDYQIILVNDASPDQTFAVISDLCSKDKKLIGINLSKNFGQQAAKMAAIPYIDGDITVFMDDDGQHPSEYIFTLIDKIQEGNDLVFANFKNKKHSKLKRFGSEVNNIMATKLIGKPLNIALSSFYAVKTQIVRELINYKSPFPYDFGYLMKVTTRITNVDLPHNERLAGETGYSFMKMFMLWLNGFTSFSVVPLRIASFLGVIIGMSGFVFGLYVIFRKFVEPTVPIGYTSVMAVLLFLGGIIMLMLGLMGEYIGRIFMTINNLPQYVIRETINVKNTK